jgi:putative transposase
MAMRTPFAIGEWYHCFSRGVDKRRVFECKADYERFLLSLYVGNSSKPIHISNLQNKELAHVLLDDSLTSKGPIVEIGVYCLMPNHFHLMLKEIVEGGIPLFMQKVLTGYTMYFNKKNERTGALFSGTFKSRHVDTDIYAKHLISYIHFNPAELFDSRWKEGKGNLRILEQRLPAYRYSSLSSFINPGTPERKLLGESVFELVEGRIDFKAMLAEAHEYYQDCIKVKP